MSLNPCNRHLLVQIIEEGGEDESSILLPDDYSVKPSHTKVILKAKAEDCNLNAAPGSKLLINNTMLEEISVDGNTYCLVLENYVLGYFS